MHRKTSSLIKSSKLANCEVKCSVGHLCEGRRRENQTVRVVLYAVLIVLGLNFCANATVIGTAIGFGTIHRTNLFGRQRVWGTTGYGLTAFVASRLYGHFKSDYVYIIIFICSSILSILITSFIRIRPNKHQKKRNDFSTDENSKTTETKSGIFAVLPLLKKIEVIIFLLITLIWGMSFAVLDPVSFSLLTKQMPMNYFSI